MACWGNGFGRCQKGPDHHGDHPDQAGRALRFDGPFSEKFSQFLSHPGDPRIEEGKRR
jgi:hypothetical protein